MSVQRTNISHRYKIHSHFLQIFHKFDNLSKVVLHFTNCNINAFQSLCIICIDKVCMYEIMYYAHAYILCVYIFVCSSGREGVTSLVTVIAASFLRDCRSHHCLCSCPYLVFIWCASQYFGSAHNIFQVISSGLDWLEAGWSRWSKLLKWNRNCVMWFQNILFVKELNDQDLMKK